MEEGGKRIPVSSEAAFLELFHPPQRWLGSSLSQTTGGKAKTFRALGGAKRGRFAYGFDFE